MAQLECGKVQIYTGDGKGKTTAALGLSLRARGLGLDVLFLQFAKKLVCAEHEIAPQIGLEIAQATRETPELCAQQILNLAHWALAPAGDAPDASIPIAARNKPVDVLVLDEVGYAMHRGYVTRADIEKLIASKPATTELVLTGRGLLDLADRADLVTEMVPINTILTKAFSPGAASSTRAQSQNVPGARERDPASYRSGGRWQKESPSQPR